MKTHTYITIHRQLCMSKDVIPLKTGKPNCRKKKKKPIEQSKSNPRKLPGQRRLGWTVAAPCPSSPQTPSSSPSSSSKALYQTKPIQSNPTPIKQMIYLDAKNSRRKEGSNSLFLAKITFNLN